MYQQQVAQVVHRKLACTLGHWNITYAQTDRETDMRTRTRARAHTHTHTHKHARPNTQDAQDAAKKPRVEEGLPAKRPEPDKTGWFAGWEDMLGLKRGGYVGMGTATKTNHKGSSPGKAGLVGVMGGGFHAGKAHHKSMKKRIHDQAVRA